MSVSNDVTTQQHGARPTRVSVFQVFPHVTQAESRFTSRLAALSEFSFGTVIAPSEVHQQLKLSDFDIHLVGRPFKKRLRDKVRFFMRCVKLAREQKKKSRLDLIVCYDPMFSGLIGVVLKRLTGAKLIVEVNGAFGSSALYAALGRVGQIKWKLYPRLQRFVLRRADAAKLLFEKQLAHLDQSGLPRTYVYFDYSDVAPRAFAETHSNTVLSLGFPSHIKGLDLLVTSFMSLADEFPDWKLTLYGFYRPDEVSNLRGIAGDSRRVEINKPVSFDDIPGVIDDCEIFVLASRTEAMGRVLVESMARSKPRIGSNVDGIPTVINDKFDGLLFETENVDDLTAKLRSLMENGEYREQLARAGYERFHKEFTLEKYADYTKGMYIDVCEVR